MSQVVFEIPMPGADTSPNSRAHFAKVYKAKKRSKLETTRALMCARILKKPVAAYQLHFQFPDRTRRDLDNFTGRCKAALDAVAAWTGDDDSMWDMKAPTREVVPSKCSGTVVVTLHYREGGA